MHKNLLQQYFPMILARFEVENIIRNNPSLNAIFQSWEPEQQKEFLDFCTGEIGVKILYDSFFKEVFNAEYCPHRLEALLTTILKQVVKIIQVLPNDTTRLADETSLLITDIIVELADHSIANVEIQKIGYLFPGQRSACYSADLLLRQYKRLRDENKKKFTYKQVRNVYTIIFFETSTKEFHRFPNKYLHHFCQKSDTGLELNLLQEYYFIPLDIFRKNVENKGIKTDLDAWLTFLTTDEPEMILKLIAAFPEFKELYQNIYELCENIEGVMNMFSKELRELDRNTVEYMIDEMQNEINQKNAIIEENNVLLTEKDAQLEEKDAQLVEKDVLLAEKDQHMYLVNQLYSLLAKDNRQEDMQRAFVDEAFREDLLKEYRLV